MTSIRQNHYLLILALALSVCCICTTASASNQLTGHPSPYLTLHADDPGHWQSWQAKAQPLIPIAPGKWVIEDLVFYSPMTLWLEATLAAPELDSKVRGSATEMMQRVTREMLDRPYYHGSFIMLRANSQR